MLVCVRYAGSLLRRLEKEGGREKGRTIVDEADRLTDWLNDVAGLVVSSQFVLRARSLSSKGT